MIIAISGKIGSGKDTVAKIIQTHESQEYYDWRIKHWADGVKEVAAVILNQPKGSFDVRSYKESNLGSGWGGMSVREFLQRLGTDAIRKNLHTNAWINVLMAKYYQVNNWLIPDTRFPNELFATKREKGLSVRVERKARFKTWTNLYGREDLNANFKTDTNPITADQLGSMLKDFAFQGKEGLLYKIYHESETALDKAKFDIVIENDGSFAELERKVYEQVIQKLIDDERDSKRLRKYPGT